MIAVCSDIHDNIWALERAIVRMSEADAIVFCGDFCAPFTLAQLAEGVAPRPLHVIWGNNDGDRHLLTRIGANYEHVHLHGEFLDQDIDGIRVVANHYPEIARRLIGGVNTGLVLYGHDHIAHHERIGDTVLLNPGEIMGRFDRRTIACVDTAVALSIDFVHLD